MIQKFKQDAKLVLFAKNKHNEVVGVHLEYV